MKNQIKSSRPVSRILYPFRQNRNELLSFILPLHCCKDHSDLPPRYRASNPKIPVYMVFQPIRRTATNVTTGTGELLPHLFTLILRQAQDGYFLLRYYTLTDIFRLRSMVLCVVRTFLHSHYCGKSDRTVCCNAKV